METNVTSSQFRLSLNDFWKGLILAVLVPVIGIIKTSIDAGSLTFNWQQIATLAISGLLGYLFKNFLDKPKVVISDATKDQMEAIKEGKAHAVITPK